MNDFWAEELTEEETAALVERAARQIERRRMVAPAILALEMHKPLANVGANLALVLAPFLVPFFGFEGVNDYSRLFRKRDNVERLMNRLECPDKSEAAPPPSAPRP